MGILRSIIILSASLFFLISCDAQQAQNQSENQFENQPLDDRDDVNIGPTEPEFCLGPDGQQTDCDFKDSE